MSHGSQLAYMHISQLQVQLCASSTTMHALTVWLFGNIIMCTTIILFTKNIISKYYIYLLQLLYCTHDVASSYQLSQQPLCSQLQAMQLARGNVAIYRQCSQLQAMQLAIGNVGSYRHCSQLQAMQLAIGNVASYRQCSQLQALQLAIGDVASYRQCSQLQAMQLAIGNVASYRRCSQLQAMQPSYRQCSYLARQDQLANYLKTSFQIGFCDRICMICRISHIDSYIVQLV